MNTKQLLRLACWAGLALAAGTEGVAAQDNRNIITMDMNVAALNATGSRIDPEDYKSVQPVCTRCHSPINYLRAEKTWPQWQNTFSRMYENGARATDAQWGHIYKYFLQNLAIVYVNDAFEDELSDALGVSEKAAIDIVRRRFDKKFANVRELEAMPGVDKAKIEAMKSRLFFDTPPLRDR